MERDRPLYVVFGGDSQRQNGVSVFWGVDRLTEAHGIEAGVNVEVNGKHVATVQCKGEDTIIQNMEGIDLKATEM